jgi:hypothetical protein
LGRVGTADELGDLVIAIAGATFMTGTVVTSDGGASLASGHV